MTFSLPSTIPLITGIDGEDLDLLLGLITIGILYTILIGIALHMVIGGLVRIITGIDRISTGITGHLTNRIKITVDPVEVEPHLFIIITEEEVI